jgi:phosphoglucosamine mutase
VRRQSKQERGIVTSKIYFTAHGWTGPLAEAFTFERVRQCTQAICTTLRHLQNYSDNFPPRLVLGHDNRFLMPKFARAAAEVVTQNGFDAFLIEQAVPTPVIGWAIKDEVVTGGIAFTAGDAPADDGGLLFFTAQTALAPLEVTSEIEEEMGGPLGDRVAKVPITPGEIIETDPRRSYYHQVSRHVQLPLIARANLDITVDYLNGTAGGFIGAILAQANGLVRETRQTPDSQFGGIVPKLTRQNLQALQQLVLTPRTPLQVGLGLNGDGSAVAVVDAAGAVIEADDVMALLVRYLHEVREYDAAVVLPEGAGLLTRAYARRKGITVLDVEGSDWRLIGEMMRTGGAFLGTDLAGGVAFREHLLQPDGIFTGMLILEMIAHYRQNLSAQLHEIRAMIDEPATV